MGVKSTHYVTRDRAIEIIRGRLEDCSDETIAQILEAALDDGGECFMNFIVRPILGTEDRPRLEE